MTDRELLELAAKAAGIDLDWDVPRGSPPWVITGEGEDCGPACEWSPLKDDGDALRLASKLGMNLDMTPGKFVEASVFVEANTRRLSGVCECGPAPDYYAATRRAIVMAAAEIGRAIA